MSLREQCRRQYSWRDWSTVFSACPIERGQRILDLGRGPGDISANLTARGLIVTGVDRDPDLLVAAQSSVPEVTFFIDIDDLLGHEPRSESTRHTIDSFYAASLAEHRHDFRIGRRLRATLSAQGFQVKTVAIADRELAFEGPAAPEILKAWRDRLSRMQGLQRFLGSDFDLFSESFVDALISPQHRALCEVVCCIGRRY